MLNKDFKEFVELLNAHGVEYLVVGGYAMALHGRPRHTGDRLMRGRRAGGHGGAISPAVSSR